MAEKKLIVKTIPFVKLLPNLVTVVGLIIGVSSIRFALEGFWESAVYCILIATIVDGVDGRIARLFNVTSHFGAELDSLCDFVNFGLSPAIVVYLWSFQRYEYSLISWAAIMLFMVCMAIRLARFNTSIIEPESKKNDSRFFLGIAAPVGGLLILVPLMLDFEISTLLENLNVRNHTLVIDLYIVVIGLLLPSRLYTFSLKNLYVKHEYLSFIMVLFAAIIIFTVIYPWYSLPLLAVVYILSIPVCTYLGKTPINPPIKYPT